MLNKKSIKIIENCLLLVFIVITLLLVFRHEETIDEAQSWLIARDLSPLQIIAQMRYEGHSFLWHFILMPFAKLGLPVITENVISSIFAILTAFLILKKSPFNLFMKSILVFNSGLLFWYSVISRPYCMIPFLLALISIFYKNKEEHVYTYAILLALLANTHIIMLPTVALLFIFFWGEQLIYKRKTNSLEYNKKLIKSALIVIYGVLIVLSIAILGYFYCKIVRNIPVDSFSTFLSLILKTTKSMIKNYLGIYTYNTYMLLALLIFLFLIILDSLSAIKQSLIFWSQFIFVFFVHTFKWFVTPTRLFITIYTLMFWLWNYKSDKQYINNKKQANNIVFVLILFVLITNLNTYKLWIFDYKYNFNSGKDMATYIYENIPKNSRLIYVDNDNQQPVMAYLKKKDYKLVNVSDGGSDAFVTWDDNWKRIINFKDINDIIKIYIEEDNNIYLLSQIFYSNHSDFYESNLIYNTVKEIEHNFYYEKINYFLYKVERR